MNSNVHEQRMFSDPIYRRAYQQAEREGLAVLERRELRKQQREAFIQQMDGQRDFLLAWDREAHAGFQAREAERKRLERRTDLMMTVVIAIAVAALMIGWMTLR